MMPLEKDAALTSLYLVAPRPTYSGYYDGEPGWVTSPDLAIVTIAAMAPAHWTVRLTEEAIEEVDLDTTATFVGLTGKTAQLPRIIELSREFRRRGKTVIVGGPLASLDPDSVRPHADILFTGEMEDISAEFFADLEAGSLRAVYDGGRADIRRSPVPRWELYPAHRSMLGALQTTRGCPFECEFCDVIQYQGRKQRQKEVGQVVAELDALYSAGFRETFLTDDNFTVHRRYARTMLGALADWNSRHAADPMRFVTQASLDIARDPELLQACVDAGLTKLFLGIETINAASLRETNKRQNLLMPMAAALDAIVSRGISIRGGLVVGFDHDGPDIFDTIFEFAQKAPLPDVIINTLNASYGTPLHTRLKMEGRLSDGRWDGAMFETNIVPKLMSRDQLTAGTFELTRRLFEASAFEQRVMRMIACFPEGLALAERRASRSSERSRLMMTWLKRINARGPAEQKMLARVLEAASAKPLVWPAIVAALTHFERVSTFLDRVVTSKAMAA